MESATSSVTALELQSVRNQSTFDSTASREPLAATERLDTASAKIEVHYINGLPLLLVLGTVSLASFIVLLDSSIIATVSSFSRACFTWD